MNQAYIFLIFILTGILISILFDIFRILRKSFKTPDIVTYIEDVLFWLLTGLLLIYTIFKFNNGQLRAYVFLGLFIGFLIYITLFSKTFININVHIITFIKLVVGKTISILMLPIRLIIKLLRKSLLKPVSFIFINTRKILKHLYIKQKIKLKKTKILLNKTKKEKFKEGF